MIFKIILIHLKKKKKIKEYFKIKSFIGTYFSERRLHYIYIYQYIAKLLNELIYI